MLDVIWLKFVLNFLMLIFSMKMQIFKFFHPFIHCIFTLGRIYKIQFGSRCMASIRWYSNIFNVDRKFISIFGFRHRVCTPYMQQSVLLTSSFFFLPSSPFSINMETQEIQFYIQVQHQWTLRRLNHLGMVFIYTKK